jgi:hypothetical protein
MNHRHSRATNSLPGLHAIRKPPHSPRYRKQSARGPYILVGFGSGDQAMWIVLATMVSLSALALLAACEENLNNMP